MFIIQGLGLLKPFPQLSVLLTANISQQNHHIPLSKETSAKAMGFEDTETEPLGVKTPPPTHLYCKS